jgi:hypothetical protein
MVFFLKKRGGLLLCIQWLVITMLLGSTELPDLVASFGSINKNDFKPGEYVSTKCIVANKGASFQKSIAIHYKCGDWSRTKFISGMNAGEVLEIPVYFRAPSKLGRNIIICHADSRWQLDEPDDYNNMASIAFMVKLELKKSTIDPKISRYPAGKLITQKKSQPRTPKADLTIRDFRVSVSKIKKGKSHGFAGEIVNIGKNKSTSTTICIFCELKHRRGKNNQKKNTTIPPLKPNQKIPIPELTFNWNTPGIVKCYLVLDLENKVIESNENNNRSNIVIINVVD